jgi:post-segregation antitoxin (ccd killing protein)
MRMARINVYVPDELAQEAKEAGLNVSNLTQESLRKALAATRTNDWLDALSRLRSTGISHDLVSSAVTEEKDEWDRADA